MRISTSRCRIRISSRFGRISRRSTILPKGSAIDPNSRSNFVIISICSAISSSDDYSRLQFLG
ncbi:unnamed protein product [Nippostrongylus brasiliensis]|uniref:Uncharacterized protein n=1 Tax=Nippostrongylus brasiliensis TaxID=27835 RepID=A0A0N4XPU6_NIPBR|nr:unnamed protein product [Nippostrongylus brasiliensis]